MFLFEHILLTTRFKWCILCYYVNYDDKNHTGVQKQNIQSVLQRSIQSVQSVQQSIKNALCTVVMRVYHISTP